MKAWTAAVASTGTRQRTHCATTVTLKMSVRSGKNSNSKELLFSVTKKDLVIETFRAGGLKRPIGELRFGVCKSPVGQGPELGFTVHQA